LSCRSSQIVRRPARRPLHRRLLHCVPLHELPLDDLPLHRVPLHRVPLHRVPLRRVPLHRGRSKWVRPSRGRLPRHLAPGPLSYYQPRSAWLARLAACT
jgi:hypothetical protein